MSETSDAILTALRAFGLGLPGAHSKSPWPEHDDLAVNDKTFAYLPKAGGAFTLSCKLPYTGYEALEAAFRQADRLWPWQERVGQLRTRRQRNSSARPVEGMGRGKLPRAGATPSREGAR